MVACFRLDVRRGRLRGAKLGVEAQGLSFHPRVTGKEKTGGRVWECLPGTGAAASRPVGWANVSEPLLMPREGDPRRWDVQAGP